MATHVLRLRATRNVFCVPSRKALRTRIGGQDAARQIKTLERIGIVDIMILAWPVCSPGGV